MSDSYHAYLRTCKSGTWGLVVACTFVKGYESRAMNESLTLGCAQVGACGRSIGRVVMSHVLQTR